MARAYVEHDGRWNIFSTIIDDFLLDEFVDFRRLKRIVIHEDIMAARVRIREHLEDLNTLLTDDRPKVNKMTYEEAMEIKESIAEEEDADEQRTDCPWTFLNP